MSRSATVTSRLDPMASAPPLRLTSAPKFLLSSHDAFGAAQEARRHRRRATVYSEALPRIRERARALLESAVA